MIRIACLFIGYICGLFQTAYLYGRTKGIDIRRHGSGNSGTTNALRVLGKKAGIFVFVGDFTKTVIACVLVTFLFCDGKFYQGNQVLYMLYAGFGVVFGHNYPCYLHFKGGKGIAATAGMILMLNTPVTILCLLVFVGAVAITRYVSLGSLLVSLCLFITWVIEGQLGLLSLPAESLGESYVILALWAILAFIRHRTNLVRLFRGTENKLGQKKE